MTTLNCSYSDSDGVTTTHSFRVKYELPFGPQRVTANAVLIALGVLFVTSTLIWYKCVAHQDTRLMNRSFGLICVTGASALLMLVPFVVRDLVGRENFPCLLLMWSYYMAVSGLISSLVTQAFLGYSRHSLQVAVRKRYSVLKRRTLTARRARRISAPWSFALPVGTPLDLGVINSKTSNLSKASVSTGETQPISSAADEPLRSEKRGRLRGLALVLRALFLGRVEPLKIEAGSQASSEAIASRFTAQAALQNWRQVSEERATLIVMTLLNLPFVAAAIAASLRPPYVHNCKGCEITTVHNATLGGIVVLLTFILIMILYRSRKFPDPLGIINGTLLAYVPVIALIAVVLILGEVAPETWLDAAFYAPWMIYLAVLWVHFVSCPMQILLSKRSLKSASNAVEASALELSSRRAKPDFATVMQDPSLRRSFGAYLAGELAQESLMCWEAIQLYEDLHDEDPGQASATRAALIYTTFIDASAELQVNLPHHKASAMRAVFEDTVCTDNSVSYPKDVFQAVKVELEVLMR